MAMNNLVSGQLIHVDLVEIEYSDIIRVSSLSML